MYDIPMITYALTGVSNSLLKQMSNKLIPDKKLLKAGLVDSSYKVIMKNNLWCPWEYDHIDIMHVAKGKASLKLYGARISSKKLQDLPYNHLESVNEEQKKDIRAYCTNDINITIDLFKYLHTELEVREDLNIKYKVDSRSKSDPQIAELVIKKLCEFDKSKLKNEINFNFDLGLNFKFKTNDLINLKNDLYKIDFNIKRYHEIECPEVHKIVNVNGSEYKFGLGGLHSKEKNRSLIASDNEWFIDVDVSSCYPQIILNNKLYPPQIGESFLTVFAEIFEGRKIAKKNLDHSEAEVLKIMLNGLYGKLGDSFCDILYAPELMIKTTLTGQLSLLLLIERLEEFGFKVISANTDGITVKVANENYSNFKYIVNLWEKKFKCNVEEIKYKALYSHSVNSYIAIREDGSLKLKGFFANPAVDRNIDVLICKKAVINYVTKNISIEDTILRNDISAMDLIKIRKTEHGGYWKGDYLGKVARWYWSTKGESITNVKGHKIAETDDAYPLMDLSEELKDIHYEKYIKKAYQLLELVGVKI